MVSFELIDTCNPANHMQFKKVDALKRGAPDDSVLGRRDVAERASIPLPGLRECKRCNVCGR